MTMNIIFFGTPEPAAGILEQLIADGYQIVLVVTQPDRPKGRGQKVTFPAVKEVALKHSLPIEQPEKVKNNPVFKTLLQSLKADLAIVVAYGKILPPELLNIPAHGFINVHASLLPKYRGAAPIQWALLNGEKESGVTIMQVAEQLDAGDLIAQAKVMITEQDDAITLAKKIFAVGGELLTQTLPQIADGKIKLVPQNEAEVSFASVLTKESGEIDWRKSAAEIHNRVRALVAWPSAQTLYHGKMLRILKSHVVEEKKALPGTIVEIIKQVGFVVATGKGALLIVEVQPAGGKPMLAYDFAIGHKVKIGATLPNSQLS